MTKDIYADTPAELCEFVRDALSLEEIKDQLDLSEPLNLSHDDH